MDMSLFSYKDYSHTNHTRVMKKTRLPTKSKTKRHRCSHCSKMDAELIPISEKEKRWLCPGCVGKFVAKFKVEKFVNFVKAGKLI